MNTKHILIAVVFAASVNQSFSQEYPSNLTAIDKLYGLSKIWQEVNYNFAFFNEVSGLDWDSLYKTNIPLVIKSVSDYDYYRILQRFCGALKDGHTFVELPLSMKDSIDAPPIIIKSFKKRFFIVNIDKSFSEKLPIGSEIIRINGFTADEYFDNQVIPYISSSTDHGRRFLAEKSIFTGWKNSKVLITYRNPGGQVENDFFLRNSDNADWVFPIRDNSKMVDFEWLDNKIALLTINAFNDKQVIKEFKSKLRKLKRAEGIILDIRDNHGGKTGLAAEILSYFTDSSYLISAGYKTRQHIAAFKAWGRYYVENNINTEYNRYYLDDAWYVNPPDTFYCDPDRTQIMIPLIVLVNTATASAAEDFLIMLNNIRDSVFLVGEKTFGSTGQPLIFDLPGGAKAMVCTKFDIQPNGEKFVGYGIKPTIEIKPGIKAYLNGEDIVLKEAIRIIEGFIPIPDK